MIAVYLVQISRVVHPVPFKKNLYLAMVSIFKKSLLAYTTFMHLLFYLIITPPSNVLALISKSKANFCV